MDQLPLDYKVTMLIADYEELLTLLETDKEKWQWMIDDIQKQIQELCCFCKQHPTHEKYWLCKQCIDDYNREKQSTCY
jgi:predicted KAP-like P-loop ATPase